MIEFDSHTLWVKVKKQEGIGKMKFSLIIGTLNRCRELEICLESLRKQVFRDFEVIIIDQSINDSTQQLAKGFGDLYCYQMAYASKNEKIIVPASATASAINVATNAVLIPSLMQNGAVIASVASELITNMVQFVYMKKKVKFKLNMKPLVQSIITVAAMAVCVWKVGTLNFSNTVLLALEVIVGSVVYVVLNILMKNQLMLEVINMTKQRIHNATKKRI